MKLIVFADSHGSTFFMRKIMALHSDADAFAHLGDGALEFALEAAAYPGKRIISVAGNCDPYYPGKNNPPVDAVAELDGFTFFFTHGHRYSINDGDGRLLAAAYGAGADAVFYGHTHVARCVYLPGEGDEKPIYLVCPGSISLPRDAGPSYAVAETQRGQLICRTVRIT